LRDTGAVPRTEEAMPDQRTGADGGPYQCPRSTTAREFSGRLFHWNHHLVQDSKSQTLIRVLVGRLSKQRNWVDGKLARFASHIEIFT
jgi:hypothetical protein